LVAGGALAAQGEDPGSAVLGGLAAGLGARGALGAARLAGKYAPQLLSRVQDKALLPLAERMEGIQERIPKGSTVRSGLMQAAIGPVEGIANLVMTPGQQKLVGKGVAAAGVPLAAGAAGLGGVAAGALAGAVGIPGFQQGMPIDPESYGSNNTSMARMGVPTMQYM
jgi:hypothetical protein